MCVTGPPGPRKTPARPAHRSGAGCFSLLLLDIISVRNRAGWVLHSAAPPLHWSGGGQEKLKKFKLKERNMWPDRAKKEKENKSEVREKNL